MPVRERPTECYTLEEEAPAHTVQVAYRAALIAVRHRLEDISVDAVSDRPWPTDVEWAVQALMNRLHPRPSRILPWVMRSPGVTVDLDPRDGGDFELALAIAPYTIYGIGIASDGSIAWSVNDTGTSCAFELTDHEHAQVVDHLLRQSASAELLVPLPPRRRRFS